MPSYDKKGVYKINTANSADVTLIPLGFTSKLKSLGEAGSCEVYMTLLGDMIVAGDFQITADDRVIKTQGSARFEPWQRLCSSIRTLCLCGAAVTGRSTGVLTF